MVRRLFSHVFVLVAAVLVYAQACVYAHSQPRTQLPSNVHLPVETVQLISVSCTANPVSVFTGGVATIRAEGQSLENLPLRYSYTADAGELIASGEESKLVTSGLSQRTIRIICTATDTTGRSASQAIEVRVLAMSQVDDLHVPTKTTRGYTAGPSPVSSSPVTLPREANDATLDAKPLAEKGTGGEQSSASSDDYKESEAVAAWVNNLKQGKIEYKVPQRMLMQEASTITAVIHGYEDVGSTTLQGVTGGGALKQSPRMKVELMAEDDPDAFTIALDGDAVKFVPINGATMWTWKVTPNKSGTKQRLKVVASLMYPNADKTELQLPEYHATVEVDVPSLWLTITENYQHDPLKWFSYVIPGGAGFTFAAGLVVWWWKRRHKDEKV